jgi:hypothetical protein
MTVYDLIQELAQYPADDEVTVSIFGETRDVDDYVTDAELSQFHNVQLSAEPYQTEKFSEIVFLNCELNKL